MSNGFLDNLPDLGLDDEEKRRHRKAKPAPPETEEPVYSFPTKSRCPACRSLNTVAVNTKGGVQYRECRDCEKAGKEYKYVVKGQRI